MATRRDIAEAQEKDVYLDSQLLETGHMAHRVMRGGTSIVGRQKEQEEGKSLGQGLYWGVLRKGKAGWGKQFRITSVNIPTSSK